MAARAVNSSSRSMSKRRSDTYFATTHSESSYETAAVPGRLSSTSIRRCIVREQRRTEAQCSPRNRGVFPVICLCLCVSGLRLFTNEPPTIGSLYTAPRRPAGCELSASPILVVKRPTILRHRKIAMKHCVAAFPNHALLSVRQTDS